MDRRSLLQGLLAVPVVGAVDGYGQQPYSDNSRSPRGRATTLKVVIDGPFAIVIQANNRLRVRVFTPKDPLHKLYFLDGSEKLEPKGALEPREATRPFNFELPTDGLRISSQETQIDPKLTSLSFNVRTDQWCQEDYPMTIDLPRPKRISALLPLLPVTFLKTHQEACMAVVHVLEYDVTDLSKVKIIWDGGKDLRVTPCAGLIKRYEDACRQHYEREKTYAPDPDHEQVTTTCPARSKELASYFGKSDVVFFFGTGLPAGTNDKDKEVHAVEFFNKKLLPSFPKLQDRLQLEHVYPEKVCRNQATSSHMKAPDAQQSASQFTEVSYFPDCSLGGLMVKFPR